MKRVVGWVLVVGFVAVTTAGIWLPPIITHAAEKDYRHGGDRHGHARAGPRPAGCRSARPDPSPSPETTDMIDEGGDGGRGNQGEGGGPPPHAKDDKEKD